MAPHKQKHPAIQAVEARHGMPIETLLRRRYLIEGATETQIAAELGLSVSTVHRWLVRAGIPRRQWALPPVDAVGKS